jgi:hypothetical protein
MKRTIALTKTLNAEFEASIARLRALTDDMERLIRTGEVDDPAQIEVTTKVRHILDTFFEEPAP